MSDFHRVRRLPPYVFEQVNRLKAQARNGGADIVDLGMGNPDLDAPKHVKAKDVYKRQALERDLFGEGEVVLFRVLPVDEVDGFGGFAGFGFGRDAVAQQAVDGLIVAVEAAIVVAGLGAQLVQRLSLIHI